jgi:hypothetical protein
MCSGERIAIVEDRYSDSILRFRLISALPLHVFDRVGAAFLQATNVIYDVPWTGPGHRPCRGARMSPLKRPTHAGASFDAATTIAEAGAAVAGCVPLAAKFALEPRMEPSAKANGLQPETAVLHGFMNAVDQNGFDRPSF